MPTTTVDLDWIDADNNETINPLVCSSLEAKASEDLVSSHQFDVATHLNF